MKMHFKKKSSRFQKIKLCVYNSPIIKLFLTQLFALSYVEAFHENSHRVACCTFSVLEVRSVTQNGFKIQSSETLKILAQNCNHEQELVKHKLLLSTIVVFRSPSSQNFLNTFIKIAILDKIYQCNGCYSKLEQHWIKCLCVHSSPIIHPFDHKKLVASISLGFCKNSLIVASCTFGRFKISSLTPSRFKNQTNDTLTLLGQNCNYQQGFIKLKTVAVNHCDFKLKFPKHCYCGHLFG